MSLTLATILMALALLVAGGWFLWNGAPVERATKASLRNDAIAVVLLVLGAGWFLYKVTQWGEADFGNYKEIFFGVFLATAIGSWFFCRDFLGVRAGAILYLLIANVFLKAAFGLYEIPGRLLFVTAVYVGIAVALYLGAAPYRLRDFYDWLFRNSMRVKALGTGLAGTGALLLVATFTY